MNTDLLREFASYPGLLADILRTRVRIKGERAAFGPHKNQYFLRFDPPEDWGKAAVLYVHGGGWNAGEPADFRSIGQYFALRGYPCFLPGYRHTPRFRYPAQAEDVAAACREIFRLLDRERAGRSVVVIGSSAGAHLGALLCLDRELQSRFGIDPSRFAGFAGLGGVYHFEQGHPAALYILAKKLFPDWQARKEGAPIEKLAAGQKLPMLVIHSPRDGVVGCQNAEDFVGRAKELGLPVEFFSVPPNRDTHSVYTAGIFLRGGAEDPALKALTSWLETLPRQSGNEITSTKRGTDHEYRQ